MTQLEILLTLFGFVSGSIVTMILYQIPIRRMKRSLYKLRGQVYYWSRQMPVVGKRGRPAKSKSV